VTAQNVSHRLIGQWVTQVRQRADDAIIAPTGVLSCHLHHQGFQLRFDPGPTGVLTVLGAVEVLGRDPAIPSQDGVGFGDAGNLSE
jgi:hypothetical protein